jgi:hypothetical protein
VTAYRSPAALCIRLAPAIVACPLAVSANPIFSLSVSGDCPSRTDLSLALGAKGYGISAADQPSSYGIFAQSEATGASLRLTRSGGERLLERRFSSRDCRALAEAMAVVVEAYFVEVGELNRPPPAGLQPASVAEPAPSPGVVGVGAGAPRATVEAPNVALPALQPATNSRATAAPLRLSAESFREPPPVERPRPTVYGRGFVGLGAVLNLPSVIATPGIELGGGVDLARLPLSVELALGSSLPTTSFERPNRVWRWANQGVLRLGIPLAGALQYRPWVAGGLSVAMLRERDLSSPVPRTTTSPLVGVGLETAWLVGRGWFGRVDLGCLVLASQDVYRVDPSEEIGRGPRVLCSAILGVGRGGIPVRD